MRIAVQLLAVSLFCGLSGARAGQVSCRITYPPDEALIRAIVPVFGLADCPDFKCYRVEYGRGRHPKKWVLVRLSRRPQRRDPYREGKVRWIPNRGAKGTLANWDTGLTAYRYGQKFKANLNGPYTLRLVVEDRRGRRWEHRVRVEVGRVVTNIEGGRAVSYDGRATLRIPAWGIPDAFLVVSIQPSRDVAPPAGTIPLSSVYEVRPPYRRFVRPAALRIRFDPRRCPPGCKPEQILIYEYQPVDEIWKPLASQVDEKAHAAMASIDRLTRYLSYYVVCADVRGPSAPRWTKATSGQRVLFVASDAKWPLRVASPRQAVLLEGRAEPFAKVLVRRERASAPARTLTAAADVAGVFRVPARLGPGGNRFLARARDAGGNLSPFAPALDVELQWKPPRPPASISLLGPRRASRGDRLLVKLTGRDASPRVDAAGVRVRSSATDPDGFLLELTETGPRAGVYVGEFQVATATDAERSQIAARRNGERIEVVWIQDPAVRSQVVYADRTPPPAPTIESPTHPGYCQITFEPDENPLGGWRGLDDVFGAEVSVERQAGNSFVRCRAQNAPRKVHLGSGLRTPNLDLAKFGFLEFRYRFAPGLDLNLLLQFEPRYWGWKEIVLTQSPACFEEIGRVFGAAADGLWHRARLNLRALCRDALGSRARYPVKEIAFMTLRRGGFMRREFAASPGPYDAYAIDDFRLLRCSTNRNPEFLLAARDDSGVSGFSFVLDRRPDTQPDLKADPCERLSGTRRGALRARVRYKGLADGCWYFHARARDGAGSWGPTQHYEIVVDTRPPQLRVLTDPKKPLSWRGALRFQVTDAVGVDPSSIRVRVAGQSYDLRSPALAFDERTGELAFTPSKGRDEARLIFADGERVRVRLEVKDLAGRPAKPLTCVFVASSPLRIEPANPTGVCGWYRSMPRISVRPPDDMEGKVFVEEVAAGADRESRRPRLFRIIAAFTPKFPTQGVAVGYYKRITVYGGEAGVQAFLDPPAPDLPGGMYSTPPSIRLRQQAGVLKPGGLNAVFFRTPDFHHAIAERVDGPINFGPGSRHARRAPAHAQSARWTGWLWVDKTQEYELEAVTATNPAHKAAANLWIDGEQVLDARKRKYVWTIKSKVLLTKGYHKIRLEYSEPGGRAWWLQLFWWRPDREWRELIPAENLFAKRSAATIYYRWDHKGKWRVYRKPLVAPRGQHTLYYFAKDEAGHKEKVKTLQVNVATEKPKTPARRRG